MSSTPFTTQAVTYQGASPGPALSRQYGTRRPWLGVPGNMIELPSLAGDYSAAPSMGEVQQDLYGGATGVTRFADAARTWTLAYPWVAGRDWQVLNGFYRRAFGPGPWAWLPPEDVNRLTFAQSMLGAVSGAVDGWAATAGTLAIAAVTAREAPCGVLEWAPNAANDLLTAGTVVAGVPTPDTDRALVTIPAEAMAGAVWAKAVSGSAQLACLLKTVEADGTVHTTVTGSTITLGTSTWAEVGVTAAAGALSVAGPYVLPVWKSIDGNAVYFTTPQVSYSSAQLLWEAGAGVPRVVWPVAPGRALGRSLSSAITLTLTEAILGAA